MNSFFKGQIMKENILCNHKKTENTRNFEDFFVSLQRKEKTNMTQLIVNVEDISLLGELKRAIMMLRGVGSITEKTDLTTVPNETTLRAMEEAKAGNTIKCSSFEEYLKVVQ